MGKLTCQRFIKYINNILLHAQMINYEHITNESIVKQSDHLQDKLICFFLLCRHHRVLGQMWAWAGHCLVSVDSQFYFLEQDFLEHWSVTGKNESDILLYGCGNVLCRLRRWNVVVKALNLLKRGDPVLCCVLTTTTLIICHHCQT